MTGTIKTIVEGKDFGFITYEGAPKDLFFHKSELQGVTLDELKGGDAVTFEMGEGPKGPNATNVARA